MLTRRNLFFWRPRHLIAPSLHVLSRAFASYTYTSMYVNIYIYIYVFFSDGPLYIYIARSSLSSCKKKSPSLALAAGAGRLLLPRFLEIADGLLKVLVHLHDLYLPRSNVRKPTPYKSRLSNYTHIHMHTSASKAMPFAVSAFSSVCMSLICCLCNLKS